MVIQSDFDVEAATQALHEARLEEAFWREHFCELFEQHPGKFVAVADGVVVEVSEDLFRLVGSLKQSGFDVGRVWVRFMSNDPDDVLP